jgi:hypothetical protein
MWGLRLKALFRTYVVVRSMKTYAATVLCRVEFKTNPELQNCKDWPAWALLEPRR